MRCPKNSESFFFCLQLVSMFLQLIWDLNFFFFNFLDHPHGVWFYCGVENTVYYFVYYEIQIHIFLDMNLSLEIFSFNSYPVMVMKTSCCCHLTIHFIQIWSNVCSLYIAMFAGSSITRFSSTDILSVALWWCFWTKRCVGCLNRDVTSWPSSHDCGRYIVVLEGDSALSRWEEKGDQIWYRPHGL